jgi:hypothetical protein
MKTALVIITCLICVNSFGQTTEPLTEEKSSAWITVVADPVAVSRPAPVKKQVTVTKRKTSNSRTVKPKEDGAEEFEKTNSQVNRFKKQQKG